MSTGNLQVTTPTDREIAMTRVFDAPRRLVFDALTQPELLERWYGPIGWKLVVCEIDLRVGGAFRLVSRRPHGKDIGQYGVYREIAAPERLVHTESWEDWNPGEVLVTIDLAEREGKTT
ncbi:MAG TPA: SRPBCC domain-containing protein, partial [Thermoanaerobaculia bacterium]|nr:SRPBCC domain-containing protein [Thermoanaerobaculia bacterium]